MKTITSSGWYRGKALDLDTSVPFTTASEPGKSQAFAWSRVSAVNAWVVALVCLYVIVYILPLDFRPLFLPDETRYFEIPREMAQEIAKVLQDHESDPVDLHLEISSEVICGIELKVHGRKIAWSLEDYLETLEKGLAEALEVGQKD